MYKANAKWKKKFAEAKKEYKKCVNYHRSMFQFRKWSELNCTNNSNDMWKALEMSRRKNRLLPKEEKNDIYSPSGTQYFGTKSVTYFKPCYKNINTLFEFCKLDIEDEYHTI